MKPDGRIGLVSLVKSTNPGWMERVYACTHHMFPRVVDCHPIELDRMLTASGFQIVISKRQPMWGLPVEIMVARN